VKGKKKRSAKERVERVNKKEGKDCVYILDHIWESAKNVMKRYGGKIDRQAKDVKVICILESGR